MMQVGYPELFPPGTGGPTKPRVLVADDNRGLAEIWSFVLDDAGCEVTVVDSGKAALHEASISRHDIAVLDLQMPDLSGLDVFSRLREEDPEIEGIIITGHASMDSAIEAVNRGIYGYLVKPVAPDALRIMVDRALERQRLQGENRRMLSHLTALMQVLDTALETVGLNDVFQRMAEAVMAAMRVDEVTLLLPDEDGDLRIAGSYPATEELRAGFRLAPGQGIAGAVFADRQPAQLRDIRSHPLVRSVFLKESGIRSVLGVPLVSGGQAIGVLHVGTVRERLFGDPEVRLLEAIAERMALAVVKARLLEEREAHRAQLEVAYRQQRHIAETLQRSFLPEVNLTVGGLRVAHTYQPAIEEVEVGGDFYDLIEFEDGRVGIVMGDVSGKGLDAAVYTALLKYTLRAYALRDPDPSKVIEQLNEVFLRQAAPETFATLFYGVLDQTSGDLAYVNAGHESPLLYQRAARACLQLRSTGPLAGVIPDTTYPTAHVSFGRGDFLFLYTDGASDASRNERWLGTEGLRRILEKNLQPEVREMLPAIRQDILDFARDGVRDDMALMLIYACPEDPR